MARSKEKLGDGVEELALEPEKMKYLVWFSRAIDRFKGLKPHHMNEVRAYFKHLGVADPNTEVAFDEAMNHFGFRRTQ